MDRAPLFDIFVKNGGLKKGSVKLKHPEKLKEFLKTIRHIVDNIAPTSSDPSLPASASSKSEEEERVVLAQIIEVLEQHEFGGVYRKCILRYANEEGRLNTQRLLYDTVHPAIWDSRHEILVTRHEIQTEMKGKKEKKVQLKKSQATHDP